MRKLPPKIALRKETLRVLSNVDLTHVVGGQETNAGLISEITCDKSCAATAVAPPR